MAASRRIRLVTGGALAASMLLLGTTGAAHASKPAPAAVNLTLCVPVDGPTLTATVVWSGMPVTAWEWFVQATDGSGGIVDLLDRTTTAGTLSQSWTSDVSTFLSVSVTLERGAVGHLVPLRTLTVAQPPGGWAPC